VMQREVFPRVRVRERSGSAAEEDVLLGRRSQQRETRGGVKV
jgi:hypothetical protein